MGLAINGEMVKIRTVAMDIAAWLVIAWQLLIWLPKMLHSHMCVPGMDIECYYAAFRAFNHGRMPYIPFYHGPTISPGGCLYSPPFIVAFSSLGRLSPGTFAISFTIAMLIAFWGFASLLARIACGGSPRLRQVVRWGAITWCMPNVVHVCTIGQFDPVCWLLVAGAILWDKNGVLLALGTIAKPYTIWPLLSNAIVERRVPMQAVVALVVPVALVFALGYGVLYHYWVIWALGKVSEGAFNPQNASVPFAVLRVLHGLRIWHCGNGLLPAGPHLWLSTCAIAGPVTACYATRKMQREWRTAITILVAAFSSPICWWNYSVLALPVVALSLRDRVTMAKVYRLRWRRGPQDAIVDMPA